MVAAACTGDGPVRIDDPTEEPAMPDACLGAPCIVDPEPDEIRLGWAEVAVADDGSAWMSWTENDGASATGLFVARSAAPGTPFGAPVRVPVAELPLVDTTETPSLAVWGDRIALAYTGLGAARHGDAHAAYVQLGTWSDDAATFDPAVQIDTSDETLFVLEMARVAFAPDGEAWVVWKRQQYGIADQSTFGRESQGFAALPVDAEGLTLRHDCSPPEFAFGADGPLLTVRSNVDGMLETMVVGGTLDGFGVAVQVSDDGWPYDPAVCPTDGPRSVALPDGTRVASWIAPNAETWRLRTSVSADGVAWSEPVVEVLTTFGENWVALAAGPDGRLYTAIEELDGRATLRTQDAPMGPADERRLLTPTGYDLEGIELAAGPGRAVAVGVDDDRFLWMLDL